MSRKNEKRRITLSILLRCICSSFPPDRFFECDITDQHRLYQIIAKQKVDIIIHLAAVSETDPDPERIFHVNVQGTKNIFEARQYSFCLISVCDGHDSSRF